MASYDPAEFPDLDPPTSDPPAPDPPREPRGGPHPPEEPPHPADAEPHPSSPALPHDLEAERIVLGYVMQFQPDEPPALTRDDFYSDRHRIVWDSIRICYDRQVPPDAPIVHADLRARRLDHRVSPVYIAELTDSATRASRLEHYVRSVRRCALRRRAVHKAQELATIAETDGTCETLNRFVAGLPETLTDETDQSTAIPVVDLYDPSIEPIHPQWLVRDFVPKEGLSMVWAPPGAGKTYALLSLVHQLGCEPSSETLWGHPDLKVHEGIRRCLWLSAEERTGEIVTRASRIASGLDVRPPAGLVRHVFARGPRRVWLGDLDTLLKSEDPVDLVVLDSLTGLRPREIDGRPVKWDLDNDATSILSDALIELYTRWRTSIVIVHHTGRDLSRAATGPGYRGPTEWWATVHAMWGIMPDPLQGDGALKVQVDKMRNGRTLRPFRLQRYHEPGRVWMTHEGAVEAARDASDESVLAYYRGAGMATQADAQRSTGLSRPTVRKSIANLIAEGSLEDSGITGPGGSRVYRVPTSTAPRSGPDDPLDDLPPTSADTHNS